MARCQASIACTSTASPERRARPIDKGAGIKIFKQLGDRVEKGEPLYRIYAFDHSEYDLAVAATQMDTGYAIDGRRSPRGERKF